MTKHKPKKSKMLVLPIEDDMYRKDGVILYNGTDKEISEYVSKRYGYYNPEKVEGKFISAKDAEGKTHRILCLAKSDKSFGTPSMLALLAHEVAHYVFDVFGEIGIEIVYDKSEEAFTWYFQYLFGTVLKTLQEEMK